MQDISDSVLNENSDSIFWIDTNHKVDLQIGVRIFLALIIWNWLFPKNNKTLKLKIFLKWLNILLLLFLSYHESVIFCLRCIENTHTCAYMHPHADT